MGTLERYAIKSYKSSKTVIFFLDTSFFVSASGRARTAAIYHRISGKKLAQYLFIRDKSRKNNSLFFSKKVHLAIDKGQGKKLAQYLFASLNAIKIET